MLPFYSFTKWDQAQMIFRKGRAYEARGKRFWETAATLYTQAISLATRNHYIEHSLASLFRRFGQTEDARMLLSSIVAQDPNDLTAHVALLQIEYEQHDISGSFASYMRIRRLLRTAAGTERGRIIARVRCIDFILWYGHILSDRGDKKGAHRRFLECERSYKALLASFPSTWHDQLAVLLNGYACLLYDELGSVEEAVLELQAALRANPRHTYSMHKLATIYLEQADRHPEERTRYLEAAKPLLHALLKIEPMHNAGRLHLAIVNEREVDWENLEEAPFWQETLRIYKIFCDALESNRQSGWSLHNAHALNKIASWLWHIGGIAYRHGFENTRPAELPTVVDEFKRSLDAIEGAADDRSLKITQHKILTMCQIGTYLIGIMGKTSYAAREEGSGFLRCAVELSAQTGSKFQFGTHNSYVESYLGKIFLERGERIVAKTWCESAIKHHEHNWEAWRILGNIHGLDGEWSDSIACYVTAALGKRDRLRLKNLAVLARQWKTKGRITDRDLTTVKKRILEFEQGKTRDAVRPPEFTPVIN